MKRIVVILIALSPFLLFGQPVKKKKYPSLLWEITGNGLKKPSYLFGTMHVSSKVAFHLADSFYMGIVKADVVALETNPESWQEDMSRYELSEGAASFNSFERRWFGQFEDVPSDYFTINSLKFNRYDKRIERMLYSSPSTINNLLYRTYGNEASDFEEDTYLDLYIYQCGKKLGKKIAGVENYGESMKLMVEAYKDASKDKNRKQRSYDIDNSLSNDRLQEAYRSGNLDWLDSINRYNSYSPAFDEKFLYKRNEIQANSIDSILKTGHTLFVGVGAAHLPGDRGVIEMLRAKGYRLRPVKMGERDSEHKNQVEKIKVPVTFSTQTAEDGVYKVDIPGKFYKFGDDPSLKQSQYADMANGSYYMVTRITTNAWMWGHGPERVSRIIDSLLYENIPGKMISKTTITKNGYRGFDITNRTRRGDIQRYNIFITPFEVIVFKMSGNGEYVRTGEEAQRFFNSIQLKEFAPEAAWKTYTPSYGGFSVLLPHEPFTDRYNDNLLYDAEDRAGNTQYRVIRTDVHNYNFAEEDTFDLGLMEESFASSDFIESLISRKQTTRAGYPALDCKYKGKNGDLYLTRFIIQGPHYYTLIAHGNKETDAMKNFLNSFEIKPLQYAKEKEQKDTTLYYTVKTPVFPADDKEKLDMPYFNYYYPAGDDEEGDEMFVRGVYKNKVVANDTTGEKIFISFFKAPRYEYEEDSVKFNSSNSKVSVLGDTSWIVRYKNTYLLPNKMQVYEAIVSDTGSSRTLWTKTFYKDGIKYSLLTQGDTLTKPSAFVRSFFDSFTPVDTLEGVNIFTKKTSLFFDDFMSSDSVMHRRAVKAIDEISFEPDDLPRLKKAIESLNWEEKNYLAVKKSLISKLEDISTNTSADYLRHLYYTAGDTIELQHTALQALLGQQTKYSHTVFREIMSTEPPVIHVNTLNSYGYDIDISPSFYPVRSYDEEKFMTILYDSLKLSRTILPDLLPLLNLDDYEHDVMQLLGLMVDSNYVKAKDYEQYFSKFLLEAKQELKKQAIAEKQKSIKKAEQSKNKDQETFDLYAYGGMQDDFDRGNAGLHLYAKLLLPFWDSKPGVKQVIAQMLASSDKKLKYHTMMLLIRNGKPYPDSMLRYFASLDDYRYELYIDLQEMNKNELFPKQFNNHVALAKSKLLKYKSYDKPDSVAYIDRMITEIKGKKGYVYFFKYRDKKDDITWKLATVGLVPLDSTKFEFKLDDSKGNNSRNLRRYIIYSGFNSFPYSTNDYDFTRFSDTRIKSEEGSPEAQLGKELKKLIYSKRNSGRQFYNRRDAYNYGYGGISLDQIYEDADADENEE